jgi:toxin-antitoxin system PIN domain toxin
MARALLDINVVIALLDQGHVLHRAATRWLEREIGHGWATCPITENGVVRIMAQPAYPNPQPAALVAERLAEACRDPSHGFWPEPISLLERGLIRWECLLGPRQITDAYLLALAVHHGGRFVSFDQRISLDVVPAASAAHLCLIDD